MTVILSGFADEISPDPDEQLATLAAQSITHLELRSAWSVNVADFTAGHLAAFRGALDRAGVRVSAIGSPIGKIPVEAPLGPELDRLRRIADIAGELGTTIVRVFSFFIPPGEPPGQYRDQVIDRMSALAQIASERGLLLAHENEKEIYGDTADRCHDLITSVGSALRATFDAANFVQCGVGPLPRATACSGPTWSTFRSRTRWRRRARSCPPGKATGRSARRWPRCGTRASRGSCPSSRIWRRPGATVVSAARKASPEPPGLLKRS